MTRLRESKDVIPHGVVLFVPFNGEAFFAALNVVTQGAICKSKSFDRPVFVDKINNPRGAERPRSEGPRFYCHGCTNFKRDARRNKLHPTKIELPPLAQCCDCALIILLSTAKLYAIVIDSVARRR